MTDTDNEEMRKEAEDILLVNLASSSIESMSFNPVSLCFVAVADRAQAKLNREVMSAIPAMIPTITEQGKRILMEIGDNRKEPTKPLWRRI